MVLVLLLCGALLLSALALKFLTDLLYAYIRGGKTLAGRKQAMAVIAPLTKEGLWAFLRLFGALWLASLSGVASLFWRLLFGESLVAESLLTIALSLSVLLFFLGRASYRAGYREKKRFFPQGLFTVGFSLLLQLIYASIFEFALYAAGPAATATSLLWQLMGNLPPHLGDTPFLMKFGFLLFFDALYLLALWRIQKRGYDRAEREKDKQNFT